MKANCFAQHTGDNLRAGDPPTDRGPIVGVLQDDLNALHAEIERLRNALAIEERISRLLGASNDIEMLWKMAEQFDRRG